MNVIRKRQMKYIKLCLVSPLFHYIITVLYILSFPLLAYRIMNFPMDINNYQINEIVSYTFKEKEFLSFTKDTEFISYVENLTESLYTFNQNKIPYFIPLGSIRLKKYAVASNYCNSEITNCSSYQCAISAMYQSLVANDCSIAYKSGIASRNQNFSYGSKSEIFDSLSEKYKGKYSSYNLISDGYYVDLTIDELQENPNLVRTFLTNERNLKFVAIMINLYSPHSRNYISVMCGLEMTNYFSNVNPVFTSSIYNRFDSEDIFLFSVFIIFASCCMLNILKLIYVMNLKFIFALHPFIIFNEVINLLIVIFITFYISTSKLGAFVGADTPKGYVNHLSLIAMKTYLCNFISIGIFCYPFRVLSLLAWFRKWTKEIINYLNIIFRMLPGIIIMSLVFGLLLVSYGLMLFFIYNESFYNYSTVFNSLLNLFNINSIIEISKDRRMTSSLNLSPLFLFYNAIIFVSVALIIFIVISTFIILFKKAKIVEMGKEESEIMTKLQEISEKIFPEKDESYSDKEGMMKQVMWLNLSSKHDLYNDCSSQYKILLFNSSHQIISFLKYLFAIKPEMQFRNLDRRFAIIIQCKSISSGVKEKELEQIDCLFDWLNFAGCKIPVAVYTQLRLDKNLRMSISANYDKILFLNNKEDIHSFLNPGETEIKHKRTYEIENISRINVKTNSPPERINATRYSTTKTVTSPAMSREQASIIAGAVNAKYLKSSTIDTVNKLKPTLSKLTSNNSISEESKESLIEGSDTN